MKPIIVIFFLLLVVAILLLTYGFIRLVIEAWRWKQAAPDRRRRERLELLRENQELDDLINRANDQVKARRR